MKRGAHGLGQGRGVHGAQRLAGAADSHEISDKVYDLSN
jgi:hypothetical protein